MTYKDLTLHQRISLKGYFYTEKGLYNCLLLLKVFDFEAAVNHFLDQECLPNPNKRSYDDGQPKYLKYER